MIKRYANSVIGLLIVLIVLMVTLNLLKKVPVIGGIAAKAQNLATDGTLSGD